MSTTNITTTSKEGKVAKTASDLLLVGLDLGTNTTCIQVAKASTGKVETSELVPSIVGYTTEGILPGIIPGDANALFGGLALKYKLHLDLVQPLRDGVIADMNAARDFLKHLKSTVGIESSCEVRAVIGMPANADAAARENTRLAVTGIFDKVILIPEPFLAALGCRDEDSLMNDAYVDPVCNSIFIDIGAGSSDVCLIQGYYPSAEDQISFPFAGDAVDEVIQEEILNKYPDSAISIAKCREIKEKHSFVDGATAEALHPVMIGGKIKQLEVAHAVGTACNRLLDKVYEATRALIVKADPDSIPDLLQNIIVTGGGSMIKGLDKAIEKRLTDEGFEGARVTSVGEDYKTRVASGAVKAAFQAKDRQWQTLLS